MELIPNLLGHPVHNFHLSKMCNKIREIELVLWAFEAMPFQFDEIFWIYPINVKTYVFLFRMSKLSTYKLDELLTFCGIFSAALK